MTAVWALLAGMVAALAAIVGRVMWRDRHSRSSHVDPSADRAAQIKAARGQAQGRAAGSDMYGGDFLDASKKARKHHHE